MPIYVAKILTYPERVHPSNKEWLKKLIVNGPDVHPGANYVEKQGDEDNKISLRYARRNFIARDLKVRCLRSYKNLFLCEITLNYCTSNYF